jgi:hypothetical protein
MFGIKYVFFMYWPSVYIQSGLEMNLYPLITRWRCRGGVTHHRNSG